MASGNTPDAGLDHPETTSGNTNGRRGRAPVALTGDHHQALKAEALEIVNSELEGRLARQSESGTKVDTKAAYLLGVVAAATQFLATRHFQPVLAILAFASYGVSFIAGVLSLAVAKYEDLDPPGLVRYLGSSREHVLARLVSLRVGVYKTNHARHERKVRLWWVALAALAGGLALSALAIVETGHHG